MKVAMLARRQVLVGLAGLVLGAAVVDVVSGCRRDGEDPPDRGKILSDLSAIVIVPAYADAAVKAKALEDAAVALRDAPAADSLARCRDAWKAARQSWKITDAFVLGPADDLSLTGGVIDTAADPAKIDAVVHAETPLDAAAVNGLGANLRGFGGTEVLLFDPASDDATTLAAFQAEGKRRGTLLALLATDLRTKIDAVSAAWQAPPVDYAKQLAQAGRGSSVYASERQGVDAIVNALISAAEVLIALHLAKPLGLDRTPAVPAPELVESPRSDASVQDLLSALDGIEMVYLGQRGDAHGLPLAAAVADRSPNADANLKSLLTKAKDAVRAIPGPLRIAVVEQRDPVILAHAAVREVKRALATDIAGALGTSVGFTVTDGD